ncbi:MAG: M48 family metallopeptidase [Burkholderiales bacterium]
MHWFTTAFLVALALTTFIRLWLATRHMRHVAANRERVPAEFADRVALTDHQKAADYTVAKSRLGNIDTLLGMAVLLCFTLAGGLQWISDIWSRVFETGGYAHGIALLATMTIVASLIELPLSIYRTFVLEARFGFNRMTPALFIADLAKGTVIGAALGLPLVALVLWLMAKMGTYWWLYVWLAWMIFNLLVLTLYPTLIAPIFNKFNPLADESLKTRIEGLLAKCGFKSRGVFVMDGSKRSSHGNAYFTGFGAAKRIVFFDTLINRLAPAEIEAVLAHELGHFKRRHIVKRIVWIFAASLVLLALLGYLIDKPWFYASLGAHTQSTAMALALFFLAVPVFTFPFSPISSLYSRKHEYEADAYAASQSNGEDLVRALVKLYQDNASTLTPDPMHSAFYDSHPPAALRIARLQGAAR